MGGGCRPWAASGKPVLEDSSCSPHGGAALPPLPSPAPSSASAAPAATASASGSAFTRLAAPATAALTSAGGATTATRAEHAAEAIRSGRPRRRNRRLNCWCLRRGQALGRGRGRRRRRPADGAAARRGQNPDALPRPGRRPPGPCEKLRRRGTGRRRSRLPPSLLRSSTTGAPRL